ncbi:MAG TPA: hypothetical protein VLV83_09005 [Acidobacteriota bacterium]|nr:hypothetical protein [Acidobacteriota bacterium]
MLKARGQQSGNHHQYGSQRHFGRHKAPAQPDAAAGAESRPASAHQGAQVGT